MIEVLEIGPDNTPRVRGDEATHVTYLDRLSWPLPNLVVWDFDNLPLPFPDDKLDVIHAHHVPEHSRRFPDLMDDLHRILKPTGCLFATVPHMDWEMRYGPMPTHYRFFTEKTFDWVGINYAKPWKVTKMETLRYYHRILERGGGRIIKNPTLRRIAYLVLYSPSLLQKMEIRVTLTPIK